MLSKVVNADVNFFENNTVNMNDGLSKAEFLILLY